MSYSIFLFSIKCISALLILFCTYFNFFFIHAVSYFSLLHRDMLWFPHFYLLIYWVYFSWAKFAVYPFVLHFNIYLIHFNFYSVYLFKIWILYCYSFFFNNLNKWVFPFRLFCCCVTSVMSDSVRHHRLQPTRLPRPWDSPGKNTGVGCHCLLQCMKVKSLSLVRLLVTPWTAACQAPPSMGFSRQEYWSGVLLPCPSDCSMISKLKLLFCCVFYARFHY